MTVPPQEWATSTVGPSCSANARRVAATESSSDVSGFCTAVTCNPAAWRRAITSLQEDPSAHAPCTSTTLRASTGPAGCADAGTARISVQTRPRAIIIDFFMWDLFVWEGTPAASHAARANVSFDTGDPKSETDLCRV